MENYEELAKDCLARKERAKERARLYYEVNKKSVLEKQKEQYRNMGKDERKQYLEKKRQSFKVYIEKKKQEQEEEQKKLKQEEEKEQQQKEEEIKITSNYLTNIINGENTRYKDVRAKQNGRYNCNLIFKAIQPEKELNNYLIDKTTAKLLIAKINKLTTEGGLKYSLSGYEKIYSNLLNFIEILGLKENMKENGVDEEIYDEYQMFKLLDIINKFEPKNNIENFENILKKLRIQGDELTYLIARLYYEAPLRRDYDNILLVDNEKKAVDNKRNYIIVNNNNKAIIVINNHKTADKQGSIKYSFSKETTDLLKNYIQNNGIKYNTNLFNSLKDTIKKINNEKKDDKEANKIRAMVASLSYHKYKKGELSLNELYNEIKLMKHTMTTHFKDYVFNITE